LADGLNQLDQALDLGEERLILQELDNTPHSKRLWSQHLWCMQACVEPCLEGPHAGSVDLQVGKEPSPSHLLVLRHKRLQR
jgi:hypothetical protein